MALQEQTGAVPRAEWTGPAPTRRARRRPTAAVMVAIVLVVAAAAGGGLFLRSQPNAAVLTAPVRPFAGDPRTLLLPAPSTSRPFVKPFSPDGTLTEQQIADGSSNPAQTREILEASDFRSGAIRQWHDSNDVQVVIELFVFNRLEEAPIWQHGLEQNYYVDAYRDQSPIAGIDRSGLYVENAGSQQALYQVVGFASRGGVTMWVTVYLPVRMDKATAETVMRQQYARLS